MTDTQKLEKEIKKIKAQLDDKKAELKASQEAEILEIKDEIIAEMELVLFPEVEHIKREKIDAKLARFRQMREIFLNDVLKNLAESTSHNCEEIADGAHQNFEQDSDFSEADASENCDAISDDSAQNFDANAHESGENRD